MSIIESDESFYEDNVSEAASFDSRCDVRPNDALKNIRVSPTIIHFFVNKCKIIIQF